MSEREKVINGLTELKKYLPSTMWEPINDALALLKEQEKENSRIANEYLNLVKVASKKPEIVRCKDCKECYFASNRIQSEQTFACGKYGIDVTPDWFRADGEAKE